MQLSRNGVAAFSRLIDCLSDVRKLQSRALEDLGQFAALAEGKQAEGGVSLEGLQEKIHAMHSALDVFCTSHAAAKTRDCHASVECALSDINRHGQTLSVVSTLTKTTAASYGTSAFVEYVSDLSRIALVIRDASETVLSTLGELAQREKSSLASCLDGLDRIGALMHIIDTRTEQISRLETQEAQAAQAISQASDSLVTRSNQHMKAFVTAVQFSDRLAQRLDHLADMLSREEQSLVLLASAHADSIAKDLAGVAQEVAMAMHSLSEIWRQGADIYSNGTIAKSIEDSLDTRRDTAKFIIQNFKGVRSALRSTAQDAESLPGTIEEANKNFTRLENSTREVAYSAMNSSLLASRSDSARHAMATLSFEVRATATKCLSAVRRSQQQLETLATNSMFGINDLTEAGTALEQSITSYESQIDTEQKRLDQLGALRANAAEVTSRLLVLVQDALHSMQGVREISEQLSHMAGTLGQIGSPTPPGEEILTAIWNSYTMDDERAVHAALYPTEGQSQISASTDHSGDDDLDDVFF